MLRQDKVKITICVDSEPEVAAKNQLEWKLKSKAEGNAKTWGEETDVEKWVPVLR